MCRGDDYYASMIAMEPWLGRRATHVLTLVRPRRVPWFVSGVARHRAAGSLQALDMGHDDRVYILHESCPVG